ncbi:MAG: hypothetical protein J6V98_07075 [Bacteroidales bacterium]|nr:hypothetical protein [Bacteroidales bacterium]
MRLCIFNPEHDLCLAKGRAHYVPPRSAVDFAHRDANIMQVLYPDAYCCSVYEVRREMNNPLTAHFSPFTSVVAWGWDAVVKHELLKRGVPADLLPSDEEIDTIRELQHRSTVLPLQPDCHEVRLIEEMERLLREREHWVMKAPWSGAGRGLRWVHGALTAIDRDWLLKTVEKQRCVIAEPNRMWVGDQRGASPHPVADLALEYLDGAFMGYSYFKTGSGVYKENIAWSDGQIETTFALLPVRETIERWLEANVWPRYRGPLGVDLMACADGNVHVSEINFRHTMGMVAHEKFRIMS